jgi:hypothetical protein
MPRLAWTTILLFVLPFTDGMTGTYHCVQPFVEMGVLQTFAEQRSR